MQWNYFPFMKIFIMQFLTLEHCRLITFKLISTFFRPPVSKALDKILCFILGGEFWHKNFFAFFEVLSQLILEHQLSRQDKQSLIWLQFRISQFSPQEKAYVSSTNEELVVFFFFFFFFFYCSDDTILHLNFLVAREMYS